MAVAKILAQFNLGLTLLAIVAILAHAAIALRRSR